MSLSRDSRNAEKQFVDHMMYVFKAPIIVWVGYESEITQEQHTRVTIDRMILKTAETEEASDFEAMLYLMTASLANPMSHTWVKIYTHLFNKCLPQNKEMTKDWELPDEWELRELRRLKQWIYQQQIKAMKTKDKQERPTVTLEEPPQQERKPQLAQQHFSFGE